MITKETAAAIAFAWQEIDAAQKLLAEISEARAASREPDFRDVFGRTHHRLQLAVPSGETARKLFSVSPDLATVVIEAHIEEQRRLIAALCDRARSELAGEGIPASSLLTSEA
jgi:hypothetical protein